MYRFIIYDVGVKDKMYVWQIRHVLTVYNMFTSNYSIN